MPETPTPPAPPPADAEARQASDAAYRLQAVLDAIPAPIFFKDADGVYLGCNTAFERYLGKTRREIIGARVFGVAPPDLAAAYRKADLALLESGGVQIYENEVQYADGGRHQVIFQKAVFRDADGKVAGLAGTMLDVTAQRRAEAELRQALEEREQAHARLAQADRLASIGTLAAGVAHELNNPLTFVLSNLAFAAEELERVLASPAAEPAAVEDLVRALEEARQGADRMRVIVRDLRALSRGDEQPHGPVEVARVLEYAVGLAWSELRHRARLVRVLGDVPPVRGSEARLGQVFLNLLVNAAQAVPEGAPDRNEIRLVARRADGDRVAIEVSDTGAGMSPETRRKIFDPFFTTKAAGVGTGLGLWVCHNLVAAHGGEIEVESEPGRGTTFRVLLPAASDGAGACAAAPEAPAAALRRRRVLVVDDEPFIGATLRRQLAGEHEVDVVSSVAEALRRLSAGVQFDAVVCDVMMPGAGGAELRAEVVRRSPALAERMLFITGGATTPEAARFLESGVTFLEKPFDRDDLRAALRRLLDGEPPDAAAAP
ncbi:MAG TPA: ATP-binding protein [Anaeromyxobacteraceae bacterium]|nr:ATP-binding protein [Anaeromyxobacteraceae bacterium]